MKDGFANIMMGTTINFIKKLGSLYFYGKNFFCPLCGKSYRVFLSTGVQRRPNAVCPGCGSFERHRLLWEAIKKLKSINKIKHGGRVLHVAPEVPLEKKLKKLYTYFSLDINNISSMTTADLTNLPFNGDLFHAVICNHVLEHIKDDHKAMEELFRIMKPGGWGSIQVPIAGQKTFEDFSVTNPTDRERLFGQKDHVRKYGMDYVNRLKNVGFKVIFIRKHEILDPFQQKRLSIACEKGVFLVWK